MISCASCHIFIRSHSLEMCFLHNSQFHLNFCMRLLDSTSLERRVHALTEIKGLLDALSNPLAKAPSSGNRPILFLTSAALAQWMVRAFDSRRTISHS